MATKKKSVLGKGLDILLSRPEPTLSPLASDSDNAVSLVSEVPLDAITPGMFQPREDFDPQALEELAHSMKYQGVIQPIVVRRKAVGFEIVAGERRWRAARLAGLTTIPVCIKQVNDRDALLLAMLENMAREDLNPLEEARGLYRLLDEFGLTHQEAADLLGRSRTHITNTLRLLGLSDPVKEWVARKQLEMGHARALLGLPKPEQMGWAERIVQEGWTVRQTEQAIAEYVMKKASARSTTPRTPAELDPNIENLKRQLSDQWGMVVDIKTRRSGKGQLVIHYDNWSQLHPLLQHWMETQEYEA